LKNRHKLLIILLIGFVLSSLLISSEALSDLTFEEEFTVVKVEITEPNEDPVTDNNFTFNSASPGVCQVTSTGTSGVTIENPNLEWALTAIAGSTQTSNPDPPTGSSIKFTFTGLPTDNGEFGEKKLVLRHPETDCDVTQVVEIFFDRDADNNPGGTERNWYYYWNADNVVSDLSDFEYDDDDDVFGYYNPNDGKLYIANLAPTANDGPTTVTHKTRVPSLSFDIGADGEGIDCCAETCAHEKKHKQIDDDWGGQTDTDGDGIPDSEENQAPYYFDPYDPDTYDLENTIHSDYADYGDQEFLCRMEETNPGAVDSSDDWSDTNGKNWDQ